MPVAKRYATRPDRGARAPRRRWTTHPASKGHALLDADVAVGAPRSGRVRGLSEQLPWPPRDGCEIRRRNKPIPPAPWRIARSRRIPHAGALVLIPDRHQEVSPAGRMQPRPSPRNARGSGWFPQSLVCRAVRHSCDTSCGQLTRMISPWGCQVHVRPWSETGYGLRCMLGHRLAF